MIVFKEDFTQRYVEKLTHKILQELKAKLPDTDFLVNMQLKADEVVREIVKEVR